MSKIRQGEVILVNPEGWPIQDPPDNPTPPGKTLEEEVDILIQFAENAIW